LVNAQGLKKPSFYGYVFLARLGSEQVLGDQIMFNPTR
jgi:beta-xylosidase